MTLRGRDNSLQEESKHEERKEDDAERADERDEGDHVDENNAGEKSRNDATDGGLGFSPERNEQPCHPIELQEADKDDGQHRQWIIGQVQVGVGAPGKTDGQKKEDECPASGLAGTAFSTSQVGDACHVKTERNGDGNDAQNDLYGIGGSGPRCA